MLLQLSRRLLSYVEAQAFEVPEGYVEVSTTGDEVLLTCELGQVRADDLNVVVSDHEVCVRVVKGGLTKYSRNFKTERIDSSKARISYLNGVLEVRAPRKRIVF